MALSLSTIKTELDTDPQALGYSALTSVRNFQGAADLMNGADPAAAVVSRKRVSMDELIPALVGSEFILLPEPDRQLWQIIVTAFKDDGVPMEDPGLRSLVESVFKTGTSRTNLLKLYTKRATRAEAIHNEEGIAPSANDIETALLRG